MLRNDKERIVGELTDRLRSSQTLIVADYRGLTVKEVDELRTKLLEHGATFTVVKNSLTRRAAEAAGAEAVLALLEGPSAIAFLEANGDPVAVAKALADSAKSTRILEVRGGVLEGRTISASDVEELAKLPPTDVLRAQVVGGLTAPLYAIVGLFTAPLRDLHGLVQARIDQLGGEASAEAPTEPEDATEAQTEPETEEPRAEAEAEPQAEAEAEEEPQANEIPTETAEAVEASGEEE